MGSTQEFIEQRISHWVPLQVLSTPDLPQVDLANLHALRIEYQIKYDDSPVMESPYSFLAKIQPELRTITLNSAYLKTVSPKDRDLVERFLIWHELAHVLPNTTESLCDSIALRAVHEELWTTN